jgi:hypothetical protein
MSHTDRDVQVATLKLIGALAAKLTGKTVAIRVEDGDGNFIRIIYRESDVEWLSPSVAELERSDVPPEP